MGPCYNWWWPISFCKSSWHSFCHVCLHVHVTHSQNDTVFNADAVTMWEAYGDVITSIAVTHFVSFGLCFNLFAFSMLWVSLTMRQLIAFYTYLAAFATVPLSYFINNFTVNYVVNRAGPNPMLNNLDQQQAYFPLTLFLSKFTMLCGIFCIISSSGDSD